MGESWTTGERVGCRALSDLRDHRLRAERFGEVNYPLYLALLHHMDTIIVRVGELDEEPNLVMEEVLDALTRIAERHKRAGELHAEEERKAEERYKQLQESKAPLEEEKASIAQTADEWRARAERAENELNTLTSSLRYDADGPKATQPAAEPEANLQEWCRAIAVLQAEHSRVILAREDFKQRLTLLEVETKTMLDRRDAKIAELEQSIEWHCKRLIEKPAAATRKKK